MEKYTIYNTEYNEWFERDRANVRLDDKEGNTIIELWDADASMVKNG